MLPRPPLYIQGVPVCDLPDGVYGPDLDEVSLADARMPRLPGEDPYAAVCRMKAQGDLASLAFHLAEHLREERQDDQA